MQHDYQLHLIGLFVTPDGRVVSTDPSSGKPLGPDSSPLPTDDQQRYIMITDAHTTPSLVATDDSGRKIYPVVRSGKCLKNINLIFCHNFGQNYSQLVYMYIYDEVKTGADFCEHL